MMKRMYNENAGEVEQALEEIGRIGKGDKEATKSIQVFL